MTRHQFFLFWVKVEPNLSLSEELLRNAEILYKRYPSSFDGNKDKDFKPFSGEDFVQEVNNLYTEKYRKSISSQDQKLSVSSTEPPVLDPSAKVKKSDRDKLDEISKAVTVEKLTPFQATRLFLFSSAELYRHLLPSEVLDNHEINLLYSFKEKVQPIKDEIILLARTIISDRFGHRPGWFWVDFNNSLRGFINVLAYFVRYDFSEEVIIGSTIWLDVFWKDRYLDILGSSRAHVSTSIKLNEIKILKKHASKKVLEYLKRYLTDPDEDVRKEAVSICTSFTTMLFPREGLRLLFDDPSKYDKYRIDPAFYGKLDEVSLRRLMTHPESDIRLDAVQEMAVKNKFSGSELVQLVKNPSWQIRAIGIRELRRLGVKITPEEVREYLNSGVAAEDAFSRFFGAKQGGISEEKLVRDYYQKLSVSDLTEILKWEIHADYIYEALAAKSPNFIEEVRGDLLDEFKERRRSLLEKEKKLNPLAQNITAEQKDYDDLATKLLVAAGLRVVLNNPSNSKDLAIAYKYIDRDDYDISNSSRDILLRSARFDDAPKLIEIAKKRKNKNFAFKAIDLSKDKGKTILEMINTGDKTCILASLAFSYRKKISIDTNLTKKLLKNEDGDIRTLTVFYLASLLKRDACKKIIKECYADTNYYYNVITAFDRLLFGPKFLKSYFHEAMLTELMKDLS